MRGSGVWSRGTPKDHPRYYLQRHAGDLERQVCYFQLKDSWTISLGYSYFQRLLTDDST